MKFAVCLVAALGVSMQADVRTSRRDATLLKQKVATITSHAEKASRQPRKTLVTESEVNSYLVYEAREQLPTGVVEPSNTMLVGGRGQGRAGVQRAGARR